MKCTAKIPVCFNELVLFVFYKNIFCYIVLFILTYFSIYYIIDNIKHKEK